MLPLHKKNYKEKLGAMLLLSVSLGLFTLIVFFSDRPLVIFVAAYFTFLSAAQNSCRILSIEDTSVRKTFKMMSLFCVSTFPMYFLLLPVFFYVNKIKENLAVSNLDWFFSFSFSFLALAFLFAVFHLIAVNIYEKIAIKQTLAIYFLVAVIGIFSALAVTSLDCM